MSVWTEFQPLKSVILGNLFPTDELLSQLKLRGKWADAFRYINDRSLEELEEIANLLASREIKVLRPKTYNFNSPYGAAGPSLSPRDWLLVYGDVALQGNDAFANHNIRTESTLGIHDIPTLSLPTDDIWCDGNFDDIAKNNLGRPYYHTANILRCGNDIFYSSHPGRTGNEMGFRWMVEKLKIINEKIRFHEVTAEEHLDGTIMFIKPGLVVSMVSRDRLPDFFSKWEVITVEEPDKRKAYKASLAHRYKKLNPIVASEYAWFMQANPEETWFTMNGLSINEETVIFPGFDANLFNQLEKKSIECISVSMKALTFWDAGLHCCTSELTRSGELEDYK